MRAALSLVLAAVLASSSWGAAARPLELAPLPPAWASAFTAAAAWLSSPGGAAAAASADRDLLDLRLAAATDPAGLSALTPLLERLQERLGGPEEGRRFVARLLQAPGLARWEQAALLRELARARRAAAPAVERELAELAASVAEGGLTAAEAAGLPRRLAALRLYGPEAEAALQKVRTAVAADRARRVRASAKTIAEDRLGRAWSEDLLPAADAAAAPAAAEEPLRLPAYYRGEAVRGSPQAQHELALALERTFEPAPDLLKAYAWHARASALGHPGSRRGVVRLLDALSPAQVEKAEQAAAWHLAKLGSGPKAPADAPRPVSNLLVRAATAAVLIPIVAFAAHDGGGMFRIFTMMLSWLSLYEFAEMNEAAKRPIQPVTTVLLGIGLHFAYTLGAPLAPALAAGVALSLLREVFRRDHRWERAGLSLFGALLFGLMPAFLNTLRELPHGEAWTFLAFLSAWASDTAAYLVGRRFGRRKVAPVLSPKKTWEGTLAGFAAAAAVVLAFKALVPGMMGWPAAAAAAVVMGALAQLGGFASSMIKRGLGVKDSGTLLPGHGGVIDRFDAFLLAAPALALLAWLSR